MLLVVRHGPANVLLNGFRRECGTRDGVNVLNRALLDIHLLVLGQHVLLHLRHILGALLTLQRNHLDNLVLLDIHLDRCRAVISLHVLCERGGVDNVGAVLFLAHDVLSTGSDKSHCQQDG